MALPQAVARRKVRAFNSECKIPKAEFEMARPQAVGRRNGGRLQRLACRKVRVWGMARIRALYPEGIKSISLRLRGTRLRKVAIQARSWFA